jgi:fermentation-respiration switch protein FrsA (DUF1100 family)
MSSSAVSVEDVTFRSGSDDCAAWLVRPAATPGSQAPPVVVMAHGFAGTRELGLMPFAEEFASRGLAVLVFDYRRFGGSSGEPRQLVNVEDQLADWREAIAWVRASADVDGSRVALWGSSFSGGHVVVTASRDSEIAAIVAQVPFADGRALTPYRPPVMQLLKLVLRAFRDAAQAKLGFGPCLVPVVAPTGQLGVLTAPDCYDGYSSLVPSGANWKNEVPARSILSLAAYRPTQSAAQVSCPALVMPTKDDSLVAVDDVARLAGKMPRATLEIVEGGHFDLYNGEPFRRAVKRQGEFLVEHLNP